MNNGRGLKWATAFVLSAAAVAGTGEQSRAGADRAVFTISAQAYAAGLDRIIREFTRDTGMEVDTHVTTSRAAVALLENGFSQVAAAESPDDRRKGLGFREIACCRDSLGVMVHEDTGMAELTMNEVSALFTGRVAGWNPLAGKNGTSVWAFRHPPPPRTEMFPAWSYGARRCRGI
ncbi:MAG: substrate-binding domain-containing protein [Desulfatibacillaceae bacterium]